MKCLLLLLMAMITLVGGPLLAQDITGTWQGTMSSGGHDLRMVLKITKNGSAMEGELFSIDQSPTGFTTSLITDAGGNVEFTVPGIGGAYQGRLSTGGKSMVGNWSQGSNSFALNMNHVTAETAWSMPAQPQALKPMPASADPIFEVATIKPAKPGEKGLAFTMHGRQIIARNNSLENLIALAYRLHPKQIVGGPSWIASDKFDVIAEPDVVGSPDGQQLRSMVRKLLKERFQLTTHPSKDKLSVYSLTIMKSGPKLTKSTGDPKGLPGFGFYGLGKLTVINATMKDFTQGMQQYVLDRPVVDQTGLTGRYDFTLNWTPDESQFGGLGIKVPPPSDKADAPPGLFTAIQEQLGLKLDPTRTETDVLVIDKVEHPSAN